jgi:hypothetical protein
MSVAVRCLGRLRQLVHGRTRGHRESSSSAPLLNRTFMPLAAPPLAHFQLPITKPKQVHRMAVTETSILSKL